MSVSATILIPTWNSPLTLRYALASAVRQTEKNIEILVVGDGVTDDSRELISTFQEQDSRVTFLDLPKGENRGERNRHTGVLQAMGEAIIYLADDDILMPRHVLNLLGLLETAPFVQSRNTYIDADNLLQLYPTDLSDQRWIAWHLQDPPRNRVSITGTAHTKELYKQLTNGWNVAPSGIWTDLYLWRQFFQLPNFRGATHNEVTALQFPAPYRHETSVEELTNLYESWYQFSQSDDGHERLQQLTNDATTKTLVELSAEANNQMFQLQDQREVIGKLEIETFELKDRVLALQAEVMQLEHEVLQSVMENHRLNNQLHDERRAKKTLQDALTRVHSSIFWKLSRPLRWLRRQVLKRTTNSQ